MHTADERLLGYFTGLITPERVARMDEVLQNRTRHVTVVLEDIYKEQNASAVVRTCECLGVHEVNVVENRHEYHVNRDVVKGSDRWLDIHQYNIRF